VIRLEDVTTTCPHCGGWAVVDRYLSRRGGDIYAVRLVRCHTALRKKKHCARHGKAACPVTKTEIRMETME
jgi:hypothetical protein